MLRVLHTSCDRSSVFLSALFLDDDVERLVCPDALVDLYAFFGVAIQDAPIAIEALSFDLTRSHQRISPTLLLALGELLSSAAYVPLRHLCSARGLARASQRASSRKPRRSDRGLANLVFVSREVPCLPLFTAACTHLQLPTLKVGYVDAGIVNVRVRIVIRTTDIFWSVPHLLKHGHCERVPSRDANKCNNIMSENIWTIWLQSSCVTNGPAEDVCR